MKSKKYYNFLRDGVIYFLILFIIFLLIMLMIYDFEFRILFGSILALLILLFISLILSERYRFFKKISDFTEKIIEAYRPYS
jgi:hypothetical protein